MINQLLLFKNTDKKQDNHPDYRARVIVDDALKDAGAAWVKEGKKGKFLGIRLNEERQYTNKEGETVNVDGYVLITQKEYKELQFFKDFYQKNKPEDDTQAIRDQYTDDSISPKDIPF